MNLVWASKSDRIQLTLEITGKSSSARAINGVISNNPILTSINAIHPQTSLAGCSIVEGVVLGSNVTRGFARHRLVANCVKTSKGSWPKIKLVCEGVHSWTNERFLKRFQFFERYYRTWSPSKDNIVSNNNTSSHLNAVVILNANHNIAFNKIDSAVIVVVKQDADTRSVLAHVVTDDVVVRSSLDLETWSLWPVAISSRIVAVVELNDRIERSAAICLAAHIDAFTSHSWS